MSFELERAVRDAPAGGVVTIPRGTHAANLLIDKPLSLVGMGVVILDGRRRGAVLRIRTDGVVRVAGVLIAGGRTNMAGGGVALIEGQLELFQCTLRFNEAPVYGGGGLFVRAGEARVDQCRFEANTGRQGGAILVDETGRLTVRDSLIVQNAAGEGGGLCVKEAGVAELLGCTIADNKVVGDAPLGGAVSLGGTMTRTPQLTLSHCVVAERTQAAEVIANFARHPGVLTLRRNLLPEWCRPLGGDNVFGAPGFAMTDPEPYFITEGSAAVGAGDPAVFSAASRDVLDRPRVEAGRAPDLGAFSWR